MKLALYAAVAIALAAACSISHRTSDFVCDGQQRCAAGRTCVDGFCVIAADSGVVDTPQPAGDAGACPSQCTSCTTAQKICTIDCALNGGACNQAVFCPVGWNCNVLCSLPNQCNNGISCGGATSCTIECGRATCKTVTCGTARCSVACNGTNSCGGSVSCGTGACNVDCAGSGTCGGLVSCGLSCACDVTCRATACLGNIACKPGCTGMSPLVCTSTASSCNTCQ